MLLIENGIATSDLRHQKKMKLECAAPISLTEKKLHTNCLLNSGFLLVFSQKNCILQNPEYIYPSKGSIAFDVFLPNE